MNHTDRHTLDQLEQLSGVPQRQIRELVRLGVIPAPSSRGRGATYGTGHVERLRAWRRLRADAPPGTTNEQLRAMIDRLADQGLLRSIAEGSVPFALVDDGQVDATIHTSVADHEFPPTLMASRQSAPPTRAAQNIDALQYLASVQRATPSRVLLNRGRPEPTVQVDLREAHRAGPALALRRLRAALEQYLGSSSTSAPRVNAARSEIWHRVTANRDIEIAARGPLTPDEVQLLETIGQLLQQAIYHQER